MRVSIIAAIICLASVVFVSAAEVNLKQYQEGVSPAHIASTGNLVFSRGKDDAGNHIIETCSFAPIALPESDGTDILIGSGHCLELMQLLKATPILFLKNKQLVSKVIDIIFPERGDVAIMKLDKPIPENFVKPLVFQSGLDLDAVVEDFEISSASSGYNSERKLQYFENCRDIGSDPYLRKTTCLGVPGQSGGPLTSTVDLGDYIIELFSKNSVKISGVQNFYLGTIVGVDENKNDDRLLITPVSVIEDDLEILLKKN